MNVTHPNFGQNYRLTRAALRLGAFTVSELEDLTSAPRNTVYAFVSQLRQAGGDEEMVTFEELESLRGRPQKRYSLTSAGTKYLNELSFEQASRFGEDAARSKPKFHGGPLPEEMPLPASDIYEKDEELVVQVEVPGMSEQDVDVRIEEDGLVVRGERPAAVARSGAKPFMVERQHGRFIRIYPLPKSAETRIRHIAVENGLLEVILEKAALTGSDESKSKAQAVRGAAAFHHFKETAGS